MNIPDAAVEAAARAMDANFNPDYYPILSAMFSDYAATALAAAAPFIAAQALRDAADAIEPTQCPVQQTCHKADAIVLRARAHRIKACNG